MEKPRESDRGNKESEAKGNIPSTLGREPMKGPRYDSYIPLVMGADGDLGTSRLEMAKHVGPSSEKTPNFLERKMMQVP